MNSEEEFWSHVDQSGGPDACWPWTSGEDGRGYGTLKYQGSQRRAHRLAFFLVHGHWPKVAMHTCDNPPCCNPRHLIDGTRADNNVDKTKKGRQAKGEILAWNKRGDMNPSRLHPERMARGEQHHNAKLTAEQVVEIRRLSAQGAGPVELGRRFGVSKTTVRDAVLGITWRHLLQAE